jgi:N-formylglutamate amidohydrolase
LISVPHAGRKLLHAQKQRLTPAGRSLIDTDWHVDRLIEGIEDSGAGCLIAEYSRYVTDLNRGPDSGTCYPDLSGAVIPTETFMGDALYLPGSWPDEAEGRQRMEAVWWPYHRVLRSTLDRIVSVHGFAILLDLHSIASRVPRLFDGQLPDLNLGTNEGVSCAADLEIGVADLLGRQERFTTAVNGRFKGGYITRHYGQPARGVHAIQLEISQSCYLDEDQPSVWAEDRSAPLRSLLRDLTGYLLEWRPGRH